MSKNLRETSSTSSERPTKKAKVEGRMLRYKLKVKLLHDGKYVPAKIRPVWKGSVQHLEREGMWVYISATSYGYTVLVPTDTFHVTPFNLAMKRGTHEENKAEELKNALERLLGDLIEVQIHIS